MDSGHPFGRCVTSAAAILVGGIASAVLIAPSPATAADLPDLKFTITVTPVKATYASVTPSRRRSPSRMWAVRPP